MLLGEDSRSNARSLTRHPLPICVVKHLAEPLIFNGGRNEIPDSLGALSAQLGRELVLHRYSSEGLIKAAAGVKSLTVQIERVAERARGGRRPLSAGRLESLPKVAVPSTPNKRWYTQANVGPAPSERSGHGLVSVRSEVVILGGENMSGVRCDDPGTIHILDTSKLQQPVPPDAKQHPQERSGARKRSLEARAKRAEKWKTRK
ncbi:hypothetical protein CF336_g5179 [Tilletia laevis]|uniref:Uncharacterized protein n=1 Tax=Tilletia caries TaxID=13290 RepID=A0ABN7J906_9BASI|nr:hypothetical protein CF336_g5179 [Tilletia laevis]CAD6957225.1 unnamed protein product [Tilletia caries]